MVAPEQLIPPPTTLLAAMAYSPRDSDDPAVHHARLMGSGSDLESRCSLALRERALLIELDRLVGLAARFVALRAARAGSLTEQAFEEGIPAAIRFALEKDRVLAASGENGPWEDYEFLERDYFVPEGLGPQSANAFNSLPYVTRRDTMNLLVFAIPLDECTRIAGETDCMGVVDRARTGILTIMRIDEKMLERKPRKRKGAPEERHGS